MLQVKNLSFGYTGQPLYEGVDFRISKGQKVGLVGLNGSGKSTLLKILSGKEESYSGKVTVEGRIASVPQEIKHDPEMEKVSSVREYVDPDSQFEDHEMLKTFSGLELKVGLDSKPKTFSGGQKTKLALARALLSNADILFLDEPTNFMDVEGKHWVMNFLANYDGTVVVISHDLQLMDQAIDKILAVNTATHTVDEYKGNYSQYEKLKKEKDELLKRQLQVQQQHIARMEKGLQRMSGPGVLKVKQIHRIEKAKAALPDVPEEIRSFKIRLPEPTRVGELPIRATNISKSYGDLQVINNFNLTLYRNERVALVGSNGAGKSTLIKILLKRLDPDEGEVKHDDMLKVGYYSQEFETFNLQNTVVDTFMEYTEKDEGFARGFLGRFMFGRDKVFQKVETLSGGEKTRLAIAMLTGKDHNLLVLDEPTTYLDVLSQRIILESLKEYTGTMLLVSHTPEFVKELQPKRALLMPEQKVVPWSDDLLDKIDVI